MVLPVVGCVEQLLSAKSEVDGSERHQLTRSTLLLESVIKVGVILFYLLMTKEWGMYK